MFQNDVPLGGREHNNGLGFERTVSLFTCERRRCFVNNRTFLPLKLVYCWVGGEVGYLGPGCLTSSPNSHLQWCLRHDCGASREY